jgi:DNA-binding response OmpR family regulator
MRLLLIEDDLLISRELLLRWQARPWIVRHVARFADADAALRDDAYDVVVLDLGLPDGDGLAWLARVRRRPLPLQVLILTARDSIADRVRGLEIGDDYLVKPFAEEELEARIQLLQRRARNAAERVTRMGRLTVSADQRSAFVDGKRLDVAPREFEVLELLAGRAPRFVPKRDMVDALAQSNLEVNDSVAELYVSRLRKKLEDSGVEIMTVRGIGYQLRPARTADA